jgi:phosphoglucosamine mutase
LFEPVPQILKNVRLGIDQAADAVLTQANVREAIEAAESALNGKGRLLTRPSGTEPLIRVMAEGDDQAAVEAIVDRVVDALESVAA